MTNQDILDVEDSSWKKNVEKSNKPVMVMFHSPNCPYCMQMEPIFEEYASEFKDKVVFARINVAENPNVATRYGVMGTPTFKFFCQGRPVQEFAGAVYPTLLKKAVEDGLQHSRECVKNTTWIDTGITGYG